MEAPPAAFCLCCFLVAALAFQAEGEMYTSLQNVRQAIDVERKLIDYLRMYIDSEQQRLEDIKRFHARVSDLHSELYKGPAAATANPLVAFTLVKRLHSEWLNVVYSNEAQENVQNLRSRYKEEEAHLPKVEDLRGAAKGLMRLQDVYSLQVSSLVEGRFQRASGGGVVDVCSPAVSVSLSGDDCFLVGKVAYEQEDYYHSVQWLEESVRLFRGAAGEWSPENEGTLEDALDHLAFSHFKTGNVSYALSLSHELLHHDPMNGRVLQNIEKYEKLLGSAGPTGERSLRRPGSSSLTTRDTYERLCLTQGSQPMHFENPGLFCDLFTNNHSPALLLQPVRREVLSLQPHVELYHDFITDAEADDIKRLAQPGLKRSVVAAGEKQETADYRISKSAWLKGSESSTVGRLDQRISVVTGLNVMHPYAEFLQVVNYGIGGHYEPHFDHATSPTSPVFKLRTGNRMATFMIYLSSVEAGGSTAFIYANFSAPVVEKAAIFWWNLRRNGQGDEDTLHAGCPVLIGDKWVANKWIHESGQEFERRCSLNPEE
ncbi:prolyl 4-hydroxylase subunit alpha-3 isoform X1 [Poecilia latipinna]|uniref:Prolyl 4-hydroxylase subunit alpha-3 n=1 Tax=Poecilia latipinna TaxID=48699 RepID=A0A3B3UM71_9TELE|nr:PREDICTED: prolyl 4-hydroxylase subunit alpha-3 isoform X1 [Poecilia latipinna]XP_014896615.1 PREDICTED: prolyl 4-hydroxylase subunit alpha-3 isoform X1 [Poecilia latipinna]